MNDLINITFDDTMSPMVSGRELHAALKVKTHYRDWFPRMCEYGFIEGVDFNPLKNERVQIEGKRNISREMTDHELTIEMAKEICMIQRTDIGKTCRSIWRDVDLNPVKKERVQLEVKR